MLDHVQAHPAMPRLQGQGLDEASQRGVAAMSDQLSAERAALQDAAAEFDAVMARQWHRLTAQLERYNAALQEARALVQNVAALAGHAGEDSSDPGVDPRSIQQWSAEWRLALREGPELCQPAPVLLHLPDHAAELEDLPLAAEVIAPDNGFRR